MQLREVYYCEHCKNLVEVVQVGGGTMVCCGEPMKKLTGNTVEASAEKHIPVIREVENGVEIQVGSVEHPMLDNHYIQFIELLTEDKVCRAELKPGDKPVAFFPVKKEAIQEAREYCNLHGLWLTKE